MRAAVWLADHPTLPRMAALTARNATQRELEGLTEVAPDKYNCLADPQSDARPVDLGDIGEDSAGIWVRRHPEVLVAEDPAVWAPVDRYRRGQVDLTPDDEERLSAFELSAKLIIGGAHYRAVRARP